ncbi:MAG: nucleotide exchange factor GrpE [Oscillospiraceae bacterium]|nr:nucleotide exchange factor GrpE [Oscillospiraceae bacterium]
MSEVKEETVDETVEPEQTEEEVTEEVQAEQLSEEDMLREKVEELEKQLADEQERYKRLDAEYYNYRTRSLKEKQDAAADATAKAVEEILAVIDNFERALAAETTDETYKKGVDMIFRQFIDILKKLGVEEIEALNCEFDPNVHNAVTQVQDDNFGENIVCQVFQKGYKMGTKVIRCSMVAVANP